MHFSVLPLELQLEIMTFLNLEDIRAITFVSKAWKKISQHSKIWDALYKRNFGTDAETNVDLFFWAVKNAQPKVCEYLLSHDPSLLESKDKRGGFSPLYRAAQYGHLGVVKFLLSKGANPEATDGDGSTPFYIACQENRLKVAEYLVTKGVNIECVFLNGFTPMYIAAEMGHVEIVKMLCQKGSNVNKAAEGGATPLYIASQNNHPEVVEYLITQGANMEARFNMIYKPIYIANSRGYQKVVEILTKSGANLDGLNPSSLPAS